jgi:hypothetical protein
MFTFDQRFDSVVLDVFEVWTNNGDGLDYEEREQKLKAIRDAVTNTWIEGYDTDEFRHLWVAESLARLRGGI